MGFTISRERSRVLVALTWVLAAGAAQSQAHDMDSAPLLIASQTISDDMQQNAEESPSYVPADAAAAAAAQDPAFAARRAKMIKECEDNNGVDCKTQVDTELGAELLQQGGVKRLAPPPGRPNR